MPATVVVSVARQNVNVLAHKAIWAMVARCVAERADRLATPFAHETVIVFRNFHKYIILQISA